MRSLTQIAVPFHNAELYVVEHKGQPYNLMQTIVEGMESLAWLVLLLLLEWETSQLDKDYSSLFEKLFLLSYIVIILLFLYFFLWHSLVLLSYIHNQNLLHLEYHCY